MQTASLHSRSLRSFSSSPRNPALHSRGQEGHALNYQLSTGPPTKSNRNYEPVTRPEGPGAGGGFALFLPFSLPPRPPSHSEIYFVRARGWRTMRELGKCVTRLLALFIFARRNTPGHHAAPSIPERSGLVSLSLWEMRRYDWYFIAVPRATLTRKPYVDCKKWDTRKWQ